MVKRSPHSKARRSKFMEIAARPKPPAARPSHPKSEKKKLAEVHGRSFSIEEIETIIADLRSDSLEIRLTAVEKFMDSPESIMAGVLASNEVQGSDFVEALIKAAVASQDQLIKRLETNRSEKTLRNIISLSAFLPDQMIASAKAALHKISPSARARPAPSLLLRHQHYPEQKVESLLLRLKSPDKQTAVRAAVEFVSNYPAIVETVSKSPHRSVTEVARAGFKAVKANAAAVVSQMQHNQMLPELAFLSKVSTLPSPVRVKAGHAAAVVRQHYLLSEQVSLKPLKAVAAAPHVSKKQTAGPVAAEPAKKLPGIAVSRPGAPDAVVLQPLAKEKDLPVKYDSSKLKKLSMALSSSDSKVAVAAVLDFLKHYDQVVETASITPSVSVTDMTQKALRVLLVHADSILKDLFRERRTRVLHFLSHSKKMPLEIRKKAEARLNALVRSESGKKKAA